MLEVTLILLVSLLGVLVLVAVGSLILGLVAMSARADARMATIERRAEMATIGLQVELDELAERRLGTVIPFVRQAGSLVNAEPVTFDVGGGR